MLMLAFVMAALVLVPVAGGRLGRLGDLRLRWSWAIVIALGIQLGLTVVVPEASPGLLALFHVVSYVFAAGFLAANLRVPGVAILALGAASNGFAIAANGGVMPARIGALKAAGIPVEHTGFVNSGALDGARLAWLGDVFAVPEPLPLHNVFSVGDVLIVAGAIIVIHRVCGSRPLLSRHQPALAGDRRDGSAER